MTLSYLINGRNEVVAKVMFLLVSVILLTGQGCLSQCMLGYHPPPEANTPKKQTPPEADTPRGRHPPEADTPLEADTLLPEADTPPEAAHPPQQTTAYGQWAARFATYWNAVLLYFTIISVLVEDWIELRIPVLTSFPPKRS